MIYLHDSSIASHGNLKSSNCLVDSRWVLQIADFGLHEFRANQDETLDYLEKKRRSQLWKAPELLRHPNPPLRGTQKGDVYSFAIILYEIIGRKGPWGLDPPEVEEIVDQVCHPELYGGRICRPPLNQLSCPAYVFRCMEDCWQEDPEGRPDFRFINIRLREMQTGLYVHSVYSSRMFLCLFLFISNPHLSKGRNTREGVRCPILLLTVFPIVFSCLSLS